MHVHTENSHRMCRKLKSISKKLNSLRSDIDRNAGSGVDTSTPGMCKVEGHDVAERKRPPPAKRVSFGFRFQYHVVLNS
jgi:hypothetical protein